jgi:hypothetical protein
MTARERARFSTIMVTFPASHHFDNLMIAFAHRANMQNRQKYASARVKWTSKRVVRGKKPHKSRRTIPVTLQYNFSDLNDCRDRRTQQF